MLVSAASCPTEAASPSLFFQTPPPILSEQHTELPDVSGFTYVTLVLTSVHRNHDPRWSGTLVTTFLQD